MQMLKKLSLLLLCALLALTAATPALAEAPVISEDEYALIEKMLQDDSKDLPVSEEFRVQVDPEDLSVKEGLDENWINILLLGTDTGNIQLNYGRTDTMIILSVNKQTGKMRLSSLVRDMQVNLPIFNRPSKINAANAFGGPLLAIKTVNEAFGLNIRNYVSINFSGFKKVIDNLGGVELTLFNAEAQIVKAPFSTEPQLLNGEQALQYVRIRSLDNNFGRNERQRKLLTSLFNKMLRNASMEEAMAALTEALNHMATNLSASDLLSLVIPVFTGMEGMDTTGFPAEGDFNYNFIEALGSVVEFDHEATSQKLHAYIYENNQ